MEIKTEFLETRKIRYQKLVLRHLKLEDSKKLEKELILWNRINKFNPKLIIYICCELFHISEEDFWSKIRTQEIVAARYMFVYYMMKVHKVTNNGIVLISGFNHATVIYACKTFKNSMNQNFLNSKDNYKVLLEKCKEIKEFL